MIPLVLLYEDNNDLRNSLSLYLEAEESMLFGGSFPHANDILQNIDLLEPDVVLLDIDMPGISGIEAVQKIRKAGRQTIVIMLTVFEDNDRIFSALEAGANGYILKKTTPEKIIAAIHDAIEGGAPITPSIANKILMRFIQQKPTSDDYQLSVKEKEVLRDLVEGYSYKMIAEKQFISLNTVRNHIKSIYHKLQVNSATSAVNKAIKENLT